MKKVVISLLLIGLIVLAIFMANKNKTEEAGVNIVTSFYPMYIATLNITEGVEGVNISNLTGETTGCVHDYVLSPQELVKVSASDIFVINGSGMEAFLAKVIDTTPELNIVDSGVGVKTVTSVHDGEEEIDPHTYLNIDNYILQVKNIAQGLANLDEKNSELYLNNMNKYLEQLNKLKTEIGKIEKLTVIAEHNSFKYFSTSCNVTVQAVVEHEEGEYPSSKEISEIVETVKDNNIKILIADKGYNTDIVETIKSESGMIVCQFNTCITGTYNKDAYLNAMKENIEKINSAIMEVKSGQV